MPVPVSSRPEITPTTSDVWEDADLTSHFGADAGNVAGVILEFVNTSASVQDWGARKNGSTDDFDTNGLATTTHMFVAVGVDASDIAELYVGDTTDVDVYLVAYITNDEGAFFTNRVDKSLAATGAWTDIDISGDTGADTATCAFFIVRNLAATDQQYGFRRNGSTDNRFHHIVGNRGNGAFMAVDASEIVEGYIESTDVDFYLLGYLTDNFVAITNAVDYSAGTAGAWVATDMSADIPAGNDGAFFHHFRSAAVRKAGIRKNGETYDNYFDLQKHLYGWVEVDANRIVEQQIEDLSVDLFLWGYTAQPVPGGGIVQSVSETVEVSEAIARRMAMLRALDETVEVSEVASAIRGLVRLVGETLELPEGIATQLGTQIVKAVNESVEVAEAVLALVGAAPRGPGPHIEHGTSFPASPTEHDLFFRDDEQKLYIRNSGNTAWLLLGPEV